jgi:hypothetical protein
MITRRLSLYKPINPLFFMTLILSASCLAEQPNVLLIYVDDLGYGDLGGYGHPVIQTPNIDALAQDGMTFTNYYAPSALCSRVGFPKIPGFFCETRRSRLPRF